MHRSVIAILLVSLGVALGVALAVMAPEPTGHPPIEWLDNPRSLHSFSLESDTGEFSNQSFLGHWTVVMFGFLHCPDVCPTNLSQLGALADVLADEPVAQEIDYVFVSVDPGRDSIVEIGAYVRHFNASIRGVTGTEEQLTRLARGLGVQFKVAADSENYAVAHSVTYSIVDPSGTFRGRFRPGFDISDLEKSLTSKVAEPII